MFYRLFTSCQLALLLFLYSCTSADKGKLPYQFDIHAFATQKKLTGQAVPLPKADLTVDIAVIPEHNLLLVIDIKNPAFLINAYRLSDLSYLKSFAKKGASPNEQIACRTLQYDGMKKLLYATDPYKKKVFVYEVADIADTSKLTLPVADISLSGKTFTRPLLLGNQNILDLHQTAKSENTLLDVYGPDGRFIQTSGTFPPVSNTFEPTQLNFAFLPGCNVSKDGKHAVLAYLHTDFLELYDSKGQLEKRVQGPNHTEPLVTTVNALGGTMTSLTTESFKAFSGKPCMNSEGVYVLFDGKKPTQNYHVNTLMSFDEKLNAKNIYQLDKSICAFDIDEKTNTLYGLTHQLKGYGIIKYQL